MIIGKIVSLKDLENRAVFPQTSSEAVYMDDGKTLEELTNEGVFFGEDSDVVQLNKPEIIDKVNSKLEKITINIKEFGAKGDGITDDTQAIQNAINKVKENGTLFIPDGVYMIKGAKTDNNTYSDDIAKNDVLGLKLHSCMNVVFESKNAILKMLPNNASTCSIINIQNCENIKIIGGVIDGNKDNQTLHEYSTPSGQIGGYWNDQWRSGCFIYGTNKNIVFEGIDFINHVGDGIMGHTFDNDKLPCNITVNNCLFDKCGRTGVHVGGGKNYIVKNSKFTNILKTNTNVSQISNIGVDIEANWIYLEQVLVDNCVFDNVENGILANYCKKNIIVSNCNFINSIYHDIECREGIEQIYLFNNVMSSSLNIFSDNVNANNNIIGKLYIYSNSNKSQIIKNVLIKNNLVKQTTIWGSFVGDNFIIENNVFNYANDITGSTRTFTVNSSTISNVIFRNNTFNCSPGGNVLITGNQDLPNNNIFFEGNVFNGYSVYNTTLENQFYNYSKITFLNNTFNNLNGLIGVRLYATEYINFNKNNIICDNSILDSNSSSMTLIKLESTKCNALNNEFSSFIESTINKGLYIVNINSGTSTNCLVAENILQPSKFTTPIQFYNFTNYSSATNLT